MRSRFLFMSLFFVLLASFIAGFPLLHWGLPPTHDGEYHVIRFYEFDKTLRSGDWYPRWAADFNNGYGVPLFNYVYPLPNYVASFLHIVGASFIGAFKLNMFFATIVGGLFFYLWAKQFWGNIGGIISSIFYTYSPYHFVDIYIRGSVGEVWALAFFPAFLWSSTVFFKERKPIFLVFSGIFLALIIFSHNILAVMFMPFAISYIGLLIYKEKNRKYLILNSLYIILLGLGLSAIFWMPALWEVGYVTGLQIYDVTKNFPQLYQLLIPSWGAGFFDGNVQNQMSVQIGIANLIGIVGGITALFLSIKRKNGHGVLIAFFIVWFSLIFFSMLQQSLFIWEHIKFMHYFQFPWRFLSLEILICSFLAGSVIKIFNSKILAAVFALLAFLLGIGYATPAYYHQREDTYYISHSNFIDGTNSPGNYFNTIWFKNDLKKKKEKISLTKEKIISEIIQPTMYTFIISSDSNLDVTINTAYFPGWTVFVDKKEVKTKPDPNGLISFYAPLSTHTVKVQLLNTPVRKLASLVSIISFLSILIYTTSSRHDIMKSV